MRRDRTRKEGDPCPTKQKRTESTHGIYSLWKSWRETTAYHIRRKKNNHNDTLLIRSQVGYGRTMRVDSLCLSSSLNYCGEKILCVVSQGILFGGTNDNHKRGCGGRFLICYSFSSFVPFSLGLSLLEYDGFHSSVRGGDSGFLVFWLLLMCVVLLWVL